ncbi:MAG: hypothetical protein R3A12_16385 [Ignavibacteria bacterium]
MHLHPIICITVPRAYFDNERRKCYIVSVGVTGGAISLGDLEGGRDILEAYDEPTLILFPEGQSLSEADYYSLVSGAIDQCAKLQDRFTIIDVHTQGNTTRKFHDRIQDSIYKIRQS